MLKLRSLSAAGLIFALGFFSAKGDPLSAAGFVDALKANAKIVSLKCLVEMYQKNETNPMVTLDWSENKISYKYLYHEFDETGKEVFWSSESSGLDGSMEALGHGQYLSVKPTAQSIRDLVRNVQLPTSLYEFIYNQLPDDAWQRTSTRGLAMSLNWELLLKSIKPLGEKTLNGKKAYVFEVSGGRDRFLNIPARYQVYVNKDNLIPFAWKTFSKDGLLLSEYEVNAFLPASDSGKKSLPLPAEATIRYYAASEDHIEKQPTNWQRFKYKDVEVDGISPEETISLDPASADFIADEKSKVLISVPK